MGKLELHELFNKARAALPDIIGDMGPLGFGNFGIAVGNKDVVQKILFRADDEEGREISLRGFQHEAAILKKFAGQDFEGVEVPVLIKPPTLIDHKDFMANYTMTRLHGNTNPMMPVNENEASLYPDKYRSAGALLARFHKVIRNIDMEDALPMGPLEGTSVAHVPFLDEDTNNGLEKANRYLITHMKAGNIHGDTNLGNILERDGVAVGLIDFSHTGRVKNMMTEFWIAPTQYNEHMIEGYERESGEKIGAIVTATSLSMWSHAILNPENTNEARDLIQDKMQGLLMKMVPVLR